MSNDQPINKPDKSVEFLLPPASYNRDVGSINTNVTLPRVLGGGHARSATDTARDPFINERALDVKAVFDLSGVGRSAGESDKPEALEQNQLVTLEATDGTTLIMRADKLKEELARLYPGTGVNSDGQVNIRVLKDQEAVARGLGDWIWSRLSVLQLSPDGIVETAKDKALELLKDKLGEHVEDLVSANASSVGAKALMWAIESKLVGKPGLYRWHEKDLHVADEVGVEDPDLVRAAKNNERILVFIHGTASSTTGSFSALHEGTVDEGGWEKLTRGFAGRVYGFEHYTFSDSPIENALHLARTLPKGSRVSLITHSRGGLVGDLFCSGEYKDDLISRYQRAPVLDESGEERPENKKLREKIVAEEKEQLRQLRAILKDKQFKIERYVRVAAPASGTTILSENLDLFLSGLLSLVSAAVSLIPAVGTMGSTALAAFRRIVLEIAEKRIDPRLIPGIEAMLPNSPLTAFLAQAPRAEGVDMAVVAGTVDGDSGNFFKRIAIMLTDWLIFDQFDNDFVVDTQSMRAGLARRNPVREFYAHGHQVSHIRYFDRHDSRRAVYKWITDEKPQQLPMFHPVPTDFEVKLDQFGDVAADAALRGEAVRDKDAPLVVYLPGIMGSHLEIIKGERLAGEGDRVWFDPFHLTMGGIAQLSIDKNDVKPEGIFRRYYGDLETYLQREHEVVTFAYDWRLSIQDTADMLAEKISEQLDAIKDQPQRQLSILAHSMGGLVVRTMIAQHPDVWDRVVKRTGGNFVMLGTPNHGSHQMVENLMGKGSSIRQLAMLDFQHSLQEVIEIIAEFPGILQLLPPSGFADTGVDDLPADDEQREALDYHYLNQKGWGTLRARNRDRWFDHELGPAPDSKTMKLAKDLWSVLLKQDESFPHAERVAYVFGLDGHTPCGVIHDKQAERLHLMGTAQGDGSVSWKSGRLASLTHDRYWYMPVPHSGLTNTSEYFPALVELLRKGRTEKLERKAPRTRSAAGRSYRYDAGPALQPGAEDLVLSFFGGRPMRDTTVDETQLLEVSVRAMDLRFTQHPVMCGHYHDDSIAGAEKLIDKYLVKGALTQRERLGIYAGELGTNTIVLNPRTAEERARGSGRGAIVVGLGKWEKVTLQALTNAVRDAALQYLLHTTETVIASDGVVAEEEALTINSLLIGHNSTTHITVDASIDAIVLAVCEANQQYRYNRSKQQPARAIRKLEFIEYYMDTAISAAYAVRELPVRLEKDFVRLNARVVPATELHYNQNDGARDRLSNHGSNNGYWSRLMVVDAEEKDSQCPPECYEKWLQPAMPKKVRDALEKQLGADQKKKKDVAVESAGVAERLKYVYLSERARAETQVQQRQPGLIEALIKKSIRDSSYDADICRTLFQLMVPLDFKPAARQTQQLLMVLDGYTANLPWEMLQADDEPLALKIAMVRQLVSSRYRKSVTSSLNKTACVIGNPSTAEFHNYFDMDLDLRADDPTSLPSLSGATNEAQKVSKTLRDSGYEVETLFPKLVDDEPSHSAIQVFNTLFKKPYRILMIAAHGEVGVVSRRDGKRRTGVVLSDGVMLTAAEVGQMEVVPDLVFLNCCHLAKLDNSTQDGSSDSYNRLAYSVSRELIEMGVRCVIAAGWAVDDNAATTFSTHFFERFTSGQPFGKAVWEARKKTHEMHHNLNTWGAYQAYGDPNYVLNTEKPDGINTDSWSPVARQELTSELRKFQVNIKRSAMSESYNFAQLTTDVDGLLQRVPPEWVSRPGVQYQLAELYGAMLPEGFRHAESACLQAILHEDKEGHVPIRALELLGNLEAKQAEKLSEQAAENYIASQQVGLEEAKRDALLAERKRLLQHAEELIEAAISRLQGLLNITHKMHEDISNESGIQCEVNAERFALLASAHKRKAMVLIRKDGKEWSHIVDVLKECRRNYAKGENVMRDEHFNPYLTINRLQLDGLLGNTSDQHIELAKKAQAVARQQFLSELRFFDGVMAADAVVAMYLLDDAAFNELLSVDGVEQKSEKDFLVSTFTGSVSSLQYSVTEFKSVTKQLEALSVFLQKRAEHEARQNYAKPEEIERLEHKFKVLSDVAAALKKL